MIEWIIAGLSITALLSFCLKKVYVAGYRAGARLVLDQWKDVLNDMEDGENE